MDNKARPIKWLFWLFSESEVIRRSAAKEKMIVCVAVVGHQVWFRVLMLSVVHRILPFLTSFSHGSKQQNNPLYIQSFTDADDALKLHHIVHCSLDVIEERGPFIQSNLLLFKFWGFRSFCSRMICGFCLWNNVFSEQSEKVWYDIERGFSWPALSYRELQSVSTLSDECISWPALSSSFNGFFSPAAMVTWLIPKLNLYWLLLIWM